jgi:hypothetical protein
VAAKRALNIAANAVTVYIRRIGPLPLRMFSLIDAPLVTTLSNAEFSGFAAIASAFYVNFDSPAVSSMPDIIREQRASVEESLSGRWPTSSRINGGARRSAAIPAASQCWMNHWRIGRRSFITVRRTESKKPTSLWTSNFAAFTNSIARSAAKTWKQTCRRSYYRNTLSILGHRHGKGALMFEALRKALGNEKFFAALRSYYE